MNAFSNCAQPARALINCVHRGDDCEEDLRGADVTGGFVTTNVLLARLHREAIRRPTFGVVRYANESAGHVTFVLIARREVGRMRSAESERDTEALRTADGDIGAEFARRF